MLAILNQEQILYSQCTWDIKWNYAGKADSDDSYDCWVSSQTFIYVFHLCVSL